MSWVMAVIGFSFTIIVRKFVPRLNYLGHIVFYFAVMEVFQAALYPVLDQCDNWWNQLITSLAMAHVCFQPFVLNWLAAQELKFNPVYYDRFMFACRLSFLFGLWLMARMIVETVGITKSIVPEECKFTYNTEMLRGTQLCSYTGKVHLGWHIPMADNHYFWPSINLHAFMSFAPFAVHPEEPAMIFKAVMLILLGPLLAIYIAPDHSEAAAVWCLYSVALLISSSMLQFFLIDGGKVDLDAVEEKKLK